MRSIAFAIALFHATGALAQTAPDWRAVLLDLYRIDMAFDSCADVTPSAAEMLRLEAAIAHVEEKTGFEEDELDEMYAGVEEEALKDAEFCKRMSDASDRVRALPEDYR